MFVSNSLGTRSELFIVSVLRKLECPVLEFELLSRFFMNPLLEVLQIIVILVLFIKCLKVY
jgi:hypothetical protein